jgi:putative transposase
LLTTTKACELAAVPRSSFYAANKRTLSKRQQQDEVLKLIITNIFEVHQRAYGKRRMQHKLKQQGHTISLERISRLMVSCGLIAANKAHLKRKRALPKPETQVSLDLVERDFNPDRQDKVWVTDISYVKTLDGWLYLAVVIDLFSRRVVGWKTSKNQESQLVIGAVQHAMKRRLEAKNVIMHSDRGSQYRSQAYRDFLVAQGFLSSMGQARTCYDNAACESFFGSYKNEELYRYKLRSYDETNSSIFNYIEGFYNLKRSHSTLGYLSPVEYENKQRTSV